MALASRWRERALNDHGALLGETRRRGYSTALGSYRIVVVAVVGGTSRRFCRRCHRHGAGFCSRCRVDLGGAIGVETIAQAYEDLGGAGWAMGWVGLESRSSCRRCACKR